jgi:squalene-hopene/tetraprenyl-beta-curcumene cyclase
MVFTSFRNLVVIALSLVILSSGSLAAEEKKPEKKPNQYESEGITISAASAEETKLETFSQKLAVDYLQKGTKAWNQTRKCVACHTNGSYITLRPSLTKYLGKPSKENRAFFVVAFNQLKVKRSRQLKSGTHPAQAIYIASGLAEWDAHVTNKLSPETKEALKFMFRLQGKSGTWGSVDCWPPFESSAYHLATVAVMAASTAPGWLEGVEDENLKTGVEKLKQYLRTTTPPHDYGKVLLLWASTRMEGLIDTKKKHELMDLVWKHQRQDGGWSIRTFSEPEKWGKGNRAAKLRAEPQFQNPHSDGHQTGLAVIVLRDSGVAADDPRIQNAVNWLKTNQRKSGRWWTRSLNTDEYHFITYSGTIYPLTALSKCNVLPTLDNKTAAN